jgi:hypothetical protein
VSDAFLVPLRASEHSRDFHKPVTVKALARFDRDLELLRNRRNAEFEVHRRVMRTRSLWLGDDNGWLSFNEPMLIYVCDWSHGLEGSDDPTTLIAILEATDVRRHPELMDTEVAGAKMIEQREAASEKIREEYRHAFKENRRLLMKAWEPLVNSPRLVR